MWLYVNFECRYSYIITAAAMISFVVVVNAKYIARVLLVLLQFVSEQNQKLSTSQY